MTGRLFKNLKIRRRLIFAGTAVLIFSIAWIDSVMSNSLNFTLFYLLPVFLSTWYGSFQEGVLAACLCTFGLFFQDIVGMNALPVHAALWNAAIGGGIFMLIAGGLIRLRRAMMRERSVSELKSKMMSLVSHEFSNMLTVMKATLVMLEEGENSSLGKKDLYAMLDRVYASLRQASDNFLNQSRMESGRLEMNFRGVGLNGMVRQSSQLLKPLADQKKIRILVDVPEYELCVKADPAGVALVLQNLIGNAIKYSPEGSDIKVTVQPPGQDSGRARVSVLDHGIGIHPEDAKKIFSGFYRTEAGKKMAKGFGVGLKVSREIVESHGGRLELESSPNRGTRVAFSLDYLGVCGENIPALGLDLSVPLSNGEGIRTQLKCLPQETFPSKPKEPAECDGPN